MAIKLEKLSLDELKTLRKDVDKAIVTYEDRVRKEALAAVEAKAKEMGFSLSELTGAQKRAKGKALSPATYRNPKDATQTWSGRGRQPGWIKDLLASGKSLDSAIIK